MDKSTETIEGIVAEMRSGILSATVECEECGEVREQRFRFDGLADRIEAAWKRETQTYLDQIRDAMNQFWHEKFKAEHTPVGNAAAIREALDRIGNTAVFVAENCGNKETAKYMTDIIMDVQAAVSAPPRNCDIYDDVEASVKACHEDRGYCKSPIDERRSVISFMLSKSDASKKKKGDNNER